MNTLNTTDNINLLVSRRLNQSLAPIDQIVNDRVVAGVQHRAKVLSRALDLQVHLDRLNAALKPDNIHYTAVPDQPTATKVVSWTPASWERKQAIEQGVKDLEVLLQGILNGPKNPEPKRLDGEDDHTFDTRIADQTDLAGDAYAVLYKQLEGAVEQLEKKFPVNAKAPKAPVPPKAGSAPDPLEED